MTDDEHLVAGRYRLSRRVGTGAMGVVWEGHDERLNRPVAVKKLLLSPGLPEEEATEAVARCLREGRIAARLHHPNAITVFDVVEEDGVPCLVMEYLPSRSMAAAIAEDGLLPPERVAAIGAQVAAALTAAHAVGIVHRDIKPANILLGEDGSVKITDFGIARASDDVTVTKTGIIAGSPAYLAPELALGADPTPASDVFSLGATLYTALEGESPFGLAANTLGLLHRAALGKINPPRRSGPLTNVLIALLAVDPQERPTASMAADLLAAVDNGETPEPLPVAAPTAPPDSTDPTEMVRIAPVRAESAPRTHRPLAAAGVFVVALVAVATLLLNNNNGLGPAEDGVPVNKNGQSQTTSDPASVPVVPANVDNPGTGQEKPAAGTQEPLTSTTTTVHKGNRTTTIPTTTPPPPPPSTTETTPEPTTTTPSTPPPTTSTEDPPTEPSTAPPGEGSLN